MVLSSSTTLRINLRRNMTYAPSPRTNASRKVMTTKAEMMPMRLVLRRCAPSSSRRCNLPSPSWLAEQSKVSTKPNNCPRSRLVVRWLPHFCLDPRHQILKSARVSVSGSRNPH